MINLKNYRKNVINLKLSQKYTKTKLKEIINKYKNCCSKFLNKIKLEVDHPKNSIITLCKIML